MRSYFQRGIIAWESLCIVLKSDLHVHILCSSKIPRMRLYLRCGIISYELMYVALESSSLMNSLC